MDSAPDSCPNCHGPLGGRYCAACGQKRIEPSERSISWFAGRFVKALTMADDRFLGSIGRLLFRPGVLDRDWVQGRRRRNLGPVTLFLMANLLYFFHPTLTDLNLSLAEQYHQQPYSQLSSWMVERRLDTRGIGFEEYAPVYRDEATNLAKLLVIVHAPFFALFLMLAHRRRNPYFIDHLPMALHFWAVQIVLIMTIPLLMRGWAPWQLVQLTMFGLSTAYLWRQITVAYRQRWWWSLLKLPLLAVGVVVAHFLYRLVHFLMTFAMT